MQRVSAGPCLSAVFVDYDNIYLALKRKNEEAARRFAKETSSWLKQIESGALITSTNGTIDCMERRLVLCRCYGNPVPRRNSRDNTTDMTSFPFVRPHFLRAGFEVVDCPPLTAQLKNSSDIRMVMDIRDLLEHETFFEEFIILSGDADFTPILHRLRAHARQIVVYANDYTATPYTAICNGEIQEESLISLLLRGQIESAPEIEQVKMIDHSSGTRGEILDEVLSAIQSSDKPVPIAYLADRAQRALGQEKTAGTNWAGFGTFRTFLIENLPKNFGLTDNPPYYAFDPSRHVLDGEAAGSREPQASPPRFAQEADASPPPQGQARPEAAPGQRLNLQDSIARIHEASQAPPLAPAEYRLLFEVMAMELNENGLSGGQTIRNIAARAAEGGLEAKQDDIQFILDVVSEADPWFEQGASPALFAGRFRNYVLSQCRKLGLQLSSDEIDLIDAWFVGALQIAAARGSAIPSGQEDISAPKAEQVRADRFPETGEVAEPDYQPAWRAGQSEPKYANAGGGYAMEGPHPPAGDMGGSSMQSQAGRDLSQFPRIVRSRMRG